MGGVPHPPAYTEIQIDLRSASQEHTGTAVFNVFTVLFSWDITLAMRVRRARGTRPVSGRPGGAGGCRGTPCRARQPVS